VPAPPPPNIAGKYNIVGANPNGSTYRGLLEVIKHGEVYQFRWNAGRQYDGVGVQNGSVVAAAFASGSNGKGCGVVDYDIGSDGTLDGKWGYWARMKAELKRRHVPAARDWKASTTVRERIRTARNTR
jgi:hypothetical protein